MTHTNHSSTPDKDKNKGFIKPYAEIRHLLPPRPTELGHAHSQLHVGSCPVDTKGSPFSEAEDIITRDTYDLLQCQISERSASSSPKTNSILPQSPHHGSSSERHVHALREPHLRDGKTVSIKSQSSPSKSPSRSTLKSPSHKSPHKSALRSPGREHRKSDKQKPEDMDTYVYMAPLANFAEATSNVKSQRMSGTMGKSGGVESERQIR